MKYTMRKRSRRTVLAMTLIMMLLTACGNQAPTGENGDEKLQVAVSIAPQETFVQKVGGDLVETHLLVPPGYSPEQYEPSPQEMADFEKADVYFSIGVPVEDARLDAMAEANPNLQLVALQESVAERYPEREFAPGQRDPHIWLSPKRAMVMVQQISNTLIELDPDNEATYMENTTKYLDELVDLDASIKESLEGVTNPTFICYHPAFGYLADDYGLNMVALEEEGKEANPQRLQELVDLALEQNIRVIFYQEEIDARQAESFAEEIGGTTEMLAPLAADYVTNLQGMADAMARAMV